MSDAAPGMMSADGLNEATEAFEAVLDAESPSTSRSRREGDKGESKVDVEDLFPQKTMNRDEQEGGADEPPPRREGDVEDADDDDDDVEGEDGEETEVEEEAAEDESQEDTGGLDFNQLIQTTIDGELVELPLGEAIRSGMREKTFHKYLSQMNNAARELNAQRQQLSTYYQQHQQAVLEFDTWMNELLPEPDWPTLFRADATKAMQAKVEWDALAQKRQGIRGYIDHIRAQEAAEQNRQLHHFAEANRVHMMAAHKEWQNEKVWKRDHDSMRRTAQTAGYADHEINTLYDARAVEILWKASKYDRLMAAKPKPVKQGFTPGNKRNVATPSRNVTRPFDRAERRFSRGTAKDQLSTAFERILDGEG